MNCMLLCQILRILPKSVLFYEKCPKCRRKLQVSAYSQSVDCLQCGASFPQDLNGFKCPILSMAVAPIAENKVFKGIYPAYSVTLFGDSCLKVMDISQNAAEELSRLTADLQGNLMLLKMNLKYCRGDIHRRLVTASSGLGRQLINADSGQVECHLALNSKSAEITSNEAEFLDFSFFETPSKTSQSFFLVEEYPAVFHDFIEFSSDSEDEEAAILELASILEELQVSGSQPLKNTKK